MSNVDLHWALSEKEVASRLGVDLNGLDSGEATRRLQRFGANSIAASAGGSAWRLLAGRFASPLVIILAVAALVSLLARQWLDAIIVLGIVVLTALLSFFQEYRASIAIEGLRRRVTVRANVLRDGALGWVPVEQVVPGDVVEISAGSLIPADALVLDCRDCFVNQALLTGETMPVAKSTASSEADASLAMRGNCVYMGTSVRSGWARLLVVDTGRQTIFGSIADRLALRAPETEFELGLRRFGSLLIRLMLTVVVVVLAINIFLQRPTVETLLFAAALAVGLSPELLPAILTITLARGARVMAAKGVIVKRLNAIESLGSMDVLCTDKTGTLTRGVVELDMVVDTAGQPATDVLALANLNASLQLGVRNPLDDAVVARARRDGIPDEGVRKLAEIPYDFVRRRVSVVVAVASIFLPFLPLLAKQILLNNLLSDIPAMGIAGDNVDREWERTPHRWDMGLIRRSMLVFGLISTGFDLITFVVLLALGDGNADVFRTGWFVESLLTELWILLVIRTWRPLWRSRPGRFLVWSAPAVMLVAVVLPYLSIGALFGFVPLPGRVMLAMLAITAAYVLVSETSKALFYGRAAK